MTKKNTSLEQSFHAVAAILRDFKLTHVISTYGGSGDSGEIYDITVFDGDQRNGVRVRDLPDVTYAVSSVAYDSNSGSPRTSQAPVTTDFKSALKDITEQALSEAGHTGWETQEGSDGFLTIHANGHAELQHVRHLDGGGESDTTEFNPESERMGPFASLLAKGLTDAGATFAEVEGNAELLAKRVTVPVPHRFYNTATQSGVQDERLQTLDFKSALVELCDAALYETGHSSYENENGGFGTFTVNADGTASLNHTDNTVSSENQTFSWNNPEQKPEGGQ